MRILNISQNYHIRGGSDTYYFLLEGLLKARGHEVVPFAARHPENLQTRWSAHFPLAADFERPKAADIARFLYSWPARRSLDALLEREAIDVAHLHIYYGKLSSSILAPLARRGIPLVQTLHEYKLVCPVSTLSLHGRPCMRCSHGHFWNAVVQRCNRGSLPRSILSATEAALARRLGAVTKIDRFICVSDFQRSRLETMGIPGEKLVTVPNIIAHRAAAPADHEGRHVLYFGRLERVKGIFTLLDAVAPLPQVPVVIAGRGDAEAELRAAIERRRLSNVRLVGFQSGEALERLIRDAICTVIPSVWYETFGLTILESFAQGRPVVGSAIGGIPEVIADGKDGFLVAPGDPLALRDRIALLASRPGLARTMGHAGWRKLSTDFSADTHYRQLLAIYDDVRTGSAGRPA